MSDAGVPIVVLVVCGVGVVVAVVALAASGKTWAQFGKRHLLMDRDDVHAPASGSAAALRERDTEIRQLLGARNELRARRGEATVDVERELVRLTAPKIDPALREENRELAIARNHRRARAGKAPLDVEAEVRRKIEALTGSSEQGPTTEQLGVKPTGG